MEKIEYAFQDTTNIPEKNTMHFEFVRDNLKELEGRMLTIVEATVEKDRQKATKDIIRDAFTAKYDWLFEYCFIVDISEEPID